MRMVIFRIKIISLHKITHIWQNENKFPFALICIIFANTGQTSEQNLKINNYQITNNKNGNNTRIQVCAHVSDGQGRY